MRLLGCTKIDYYIQIDLASVQEAYLHCLQRIPSVLQMKVLIRTCCWMCHLTAPSLRQNSSYQQQVSQLKQALVVAPYTHNSSGHSNTITLSFLSVGYLQGSWAKPHDYLCMFLVKYINVSRRGLDGCLLPFSR